MVSALDSGLIVPYLRRVLRPGRRFNLGSSAEVFIFRGKSTSGGSIDTTCNRQSQRGQKSVDSTCKLRGIRSVPSHSGQVVQAITQDLAVDRCDRDTADQRPDDQARLSAGPPTTP